MKQISRRTNPTGLHEVDRKNFCVRVADDEKLGRVFWLESFDQKAAGVSTDTQIHCIASAGTTEQYFSLGDAGSYVRTQQAINELARDKPLKFRFVFNQPGQNRLCAFADGVRPTDESEDLGSSLVDILPAELGGPIWTLELPANSADADSKPCILVEQRVYRTAGAAVRSHAFTAFVMPEVMRQVALCIAQNPAELESEDSWVGRWKGFIEHLGAGHPPEEDEGDPAEWADSVTKRFCTVGHMRAQLDNLIAEMTGELE
ncbi:hypothetical protein [Stenotrophomonas oahuensis]|uniref:Uncharacterized protein n=1 Tax=Stenotrophomonas oahuensis TaxID=3003271 RepID=A0ABY9YU79_9GAMM|nr:hypothetical protein [Stenotrophomonas sp. A5586]WNH54499.1 hypothetical protein PDM29_09555 [Stenotrophomonas sp. A5586]